MWKATGWILALAGALTLANAAQDTKQGAHPSREEMLKRYDKDGDGRLSEAEREQLRKDRATREGKQAQDQSRKEIMRRFDVDGDGQLNDAERAALHAEMQKHPDMALVWREKMLKKYDQDGDGELNGEEREAMKDDLYERRKAQKK
jgi:Ca2+-binding EF-hand superfamily protein